MAAEAHISTQGWFWFQRVIFTADNMAECIKRFTKVTRKKRWRIEKEIRHILWCRADIKAAPNMKRITQFAPHPAIGSTQTHTHTHTLKCTLTRSSDFMFTPFLIHSPCSISLRPSLSPTAPPRLWNVCQYWLYLFNWHCSCWHWDLA